MKLGRAFRVFALVASVGACGSPGAPGAAISDQARANTAAASGGTTSGCAAGSSAPAKGSARGPAPGSADSNGCTADGGKSASNAAAASSAGRSGAAASTAAMRGGGGGAANGVAALSGSGATDTGGAGNGTAAMSGSGMVHGGGAGDGAAAVSGSGGTNGSVGAQTGAAAMASAGAGAAGTAGLAAGSCSANLLFCDDFESKTTPGMPPGSPWSIVKNGMGTVTVDAETPAHSGKSSIKISSDGGYQTFFALTSAPLFPHEGALYLRLYIKLEAAMTSGHNTYYKAGASGSSSSEHETRMGVMNGMLMINQPAGDRGFLSNEEYYRDGNKPGVVFAPMKWECVESFFDPANKTIDVWVNGAEVKDLHRNDWEQDPIGALHFGFEKYAGPDAVIWYDDIAVDTAPIGCGG